MRTRHPRHQRGRRRAVTKDRAFEPESVERYLAKAFGDDLDDVTAAMRHLAESLGKEELNERAFVLYEKFRPNVASCTRGWEKKGASSIEGIRALDRPSEIADIRKQGYNDRKRAFDGRRRLHMGNLDQYHQRRGNNVQISRDLSGISSCLHDSTRGVSCSH